MMARLRSLLSSKYYLAFEFAALFGGMPLLVLAIKDRGLMLTLLWVGSILTYLYVREHHGMDRNDSGLRAGLRPVLMRFALFAPIIAGMTWAFMPDQFLSLPLERSSLWVKIMVFYPLLSVWPQEMIYRTFLYNRYAPLFGRGRMFIAASALAFGFMHVLFLNWVALAMTMIGGYLFARDYAKHQSLWLACIEHALYGCLIFTVGLGIFFYSGAAWGTP
ncbi:CPBP family intramembrane glutamic endopeptidase [Micavibrio aeruginosavorus]|uniref:CPBP family intramembrane glutamic endopeptidase n=1 Tax=Micavibrio aeruginosavorus TaxID=349221 RepID=UPI003F4AA3BB